MGEAREATRGTRFRALLDGTAPAGEKKALFEVVSRFFNKFFYVLGSGKNWEGGGGG